MKRVTLLFTIIALVATISPSLNAQTCTPGVPLCVGPDAKAFQYSGNTNFSLTFSQTNTAFSFTNHLGNPVFSIDAATGDMETNLRHIVGKSLQVKSNAYAFAWENNPNYGLFFNQALVRYEFRTSTAAPVWYVDANNGNVVGNGTVTALGGNSTQWNAAFGWGNHATAGYLTSFTEVDPIFSGSPAAGISGAMISNWNTAFGWGNHATAGYLTAETDPQVGANTTDRVPKWDGSALVTGSMYDIAGNVGIGNSAPSTNLDVSETSSAPLAAVRASGALGPTYGYLAAQGQTNFDTDQSLDIPGMELGVLGRSVGGSSTDNVGVFGHSNGWGGRFQHADATDSTAKNIVTLGGSTEAVVAGGKVLINDNSANSSTALGAFAITNTGNSSIAMEPNEIQTYLAGTAGGTLYLNYWAGDVDIANDGIFGTGGGNVNMGSGVLYMDGTNNRVGIGTGAPSYKLHVINSGATDAASIWNENNYTGASTKYGIRNETDAGGTGVRYGIYNLTTGNATDPSSVYGSYNSTSAAGNGGAYGVYSFVSSSGTGFHAALFGSASSADNNWAGYFSGNTYTSGDIRVGYTTDVPGYRVAVNGAIICEELKVQDSGSWPDYVFKEDYKLMSIQDLEKSIQENGHLPNIPSAEVVAEEGISVGAMQKKMMEKIEELTLYVIDQSKKIENLQSENAELRELIISE